MGYEIKMFIGELGGSVMDEDGRPLMVVAMVDLCAANSSPIDNLADLKPSDGYEPVYLYSPVNGNERVTEDVYGKRLVAIPLHDVLARLKIVNNRRNKYRRFSIAIATLEAVMADFTTEAMGVVFYGH